MVKISDVTDLRVYQISLELLDPLYSIAYKIPHFKLRTQLINSGEAIAPLITEGFTKKRNQKEAVRFYEMAMAESDEVITHLRKAIILSKRIKRVPSKDCVKLISQYKSLSKQINSMIKVWGSYKRD